MYLCKNNFGSKLLEQVCEWNFYSINELQHPPVNLSNKIFPIPEDKNAFNSAIFFYYLSNFTQYLIPCYTKNKHFILDPPWKLQHYQIKPATLVKHLTYFQLSLPSCVHFWSYCKKGLLTYYAHYYTNGLFLHARILFQSPYLKLNSHYRRKHLYLTIAFFCLVWLHTPMFDILINSCYLRNLGNSLPTPSARKLL